MMLMIGQGSTNLCRRDTQIAPNCGVQLMKNGAKFWFVFPTGHYHASTAPSHVYGKLSSVIFKTAGDDARVIIQGPKQLHMSTPEKKKDDLQAEI